MEKSINIPLIKSLSVLKEYAVYNQNNEASFPFLRPPARIPVIFPSSAVGVGSDIQLVFIQELVLIDDDSLVVAAVSTITVVGFGVVRFGVVDLCPVEETVVVIVVVLRLVVVTR